MLKLLTLIFQLLCSGTSIANHNPVRRSVDFDWSVSLFEPELMGASEEVAFCGLAEETITSKFSVCDYT